MINQTADKKIYPNIPMFWYNSIGRDRFRTLSELLRTYDRSDNHQ